MLEGWRGKFHSSPGVLVESSQLCVCQVGGGVAVGGRGLGLGGLLGIPVSGLLPGLKGVERRHRHQGVPLVLLIHWVRILSLGKHKHDQHNINMLLDYYKQTWMDIFKNVLLYTVHTTDFEC